MRYHICFGSWHVPHVADAPLPAIIDLVLQVKARRLLLRGRQPASRARVDGLAGRQAAGGQDPHPGRRHPPHDVVEHPELVAQRIVRFANLVGRENVIAGTDCGFAQGAFTQRVHPSVMWAKYEALVEGARIASSQLWP